MHETFGARLGAPVSGIRLGFAGLEQDDELSLINMNGRIYDPVQARFITAAPLVGRPLDSQSFNRYAYVNNSPLRFRDPSGFTMNCAANSEGDVECSGSDDSWQQMAADAAAYFSAQAARAATAAANAQSSTEYMAAAAAAQEAAALASEAISDLSAAYSAQAGEAAAGLANANSLSSQAAQAAAQAAAASRGGDGNPNVPPNTLGPGHADEGGSRPPSSPDRGTPKDKVALTELGKIGRPHKGPSALFPSFLASR